MNKGAASVRLTDSLTFDVRECTSVTKVFYGGRAEGEQISKQIQRAEQEKSGRLNDVRREDQMKKNKRMAPTTKRLSLRRRGRWGGRTRRPAGQSRAGDVIRSVNNNSSAVHGGGGGGPVRHRLTAGRAILLTTSSPAGLGP